MDQKNIRSPRSFAKAVENQDCANASQMNLICRNALQSRYRFKRKWFLSPDFIDIAVKSPSSLLLLYTNWKPSRCTVCDSCHILYDIKNHWPRIFLKIQTKKLDKPKSGRKLKIFEKDCREICLREKLVNEIQRLQYDHTYRATAFNGEYHWRSRNVAMDLFNCLIEIISWWFLTSCWENYVTFKFYIKEIFDEIRRTREYTKPKCMSKFINYRSILVLCLAKRNHD
jgi:hypothetical protein